MSNTTNDTFHITGLGGKRVLKGEVKVNGAKNAALKAQATAVLFGTPLTLANMPDIADVQKLDELLEAMGMEITKEGKRKRTYNARHFSESVFPAHIAKHIRASVVATGPVLARTGKVVFPHPGGCVIGARPIDFFLNGYKKMGAVVREGKSAYTIIAPRGGLRGAEIFFPKVSVTGTETFMMTATLAHGTTVLKNAAMEPEIVSLGNFLKESGADISGLGTPTITIKGRGGKLLRARSAYTIPGDRIEAGSFCILVALAGRDVTVSGFNSEELDALLFMLEDMGMNIEKEKRSVRLTAGTKTALKSASFTTHEYPGFPTDLQAPMVTLLTQSEGETTVFETIFEGRLRYTDELKFMGADITLMDPHRALVRGPKALKGRTLESPDLRAGLAYVLAAIVAEGKSTIHAVSNIDRGYERVEERLVSLGVDIERVHQD
ncbi:MAG: UDP-N-acetylglucosamine 1-carboxyvinyltransferase [Parcubacteria group bacterium]|nr:UDP-N-acetylglucosamine 1-carboxyvinyltransferase [Parcubacteria group bacterium]